MEGKNEELEMYRWRLCLRIECVPAGENLDDVLDKVKLAKGGKIKLEMFPVRV